MIKNKLMKYIILWTILLIVGIIFIYKSFSPSSTISDYLYTYKLNKDANYTIGINKNNFYSTQTLEPHKTYISDLVKTIDVDFKTNYSINTNANIYYNYKLVNTIYVKYANTSNSGDNILWSKEYVLKESELYTLKNQTAFDINDSISLNYQDYRGQAQNFKSTYNLPVESYMELKLIVNYDLEVAKTSEKKQEESVICLKIPLLQEVFAVEENYQKAETETFVKKENIESSVNKLTVVIGIALISSSLVGILYLIRKEMKLNIKNDYEVALNRILKSYGDIVAEVVSPVETDYMKIVDVKNFDQLLDIEEEIRMPILFYETIPGEEGEFVILYDNMVYRYIISGKK